MWTAQFAYFLCLVHTLTAFSGADRPASSFVRSALPTAGDQSTQIPTDLVLSSGFCAFARQAGVLAALQDFNINVDRCVGTSSGSLAASLFAAGYTPLQIADELSKQRPIALCQPSLRVHRGAFSLRGLIAHLRTLLPKDFSQLERKLAVGVYETSTGTFRLVDDGDLPAAVAASCAIPYVFQPVLAGSPPVLMADGGVKDRLCARRLAVMQTRIALPTATRHMHLLPSPHLSLCCRLGLSHWATWAGASAAAPRRAIVHLVGTSSKKAKVRMPFLSTTV